MNTPLPPSRRSNIAPFMAMDVLRDAKALERAGRSIIHLELGEPGVAAPRRVREAATELLRHGSIGYGEALGDAPLRARIARHYGERYGVDVTPDRIIATTGSSGGFLLAFLAAFDRERASPSPRLAIRPTRTSFPRSAWSRSCSTSAKRRALRPPRRCSKRPIEAASFTARSS